MLPQSSKIYIAGHHGMVGAAIVRELKTKGFDNLLTRSHAELDLCNQVAVSKFIASEKPDYIVLAAAKVGGIHANNSYPAEFIYNNLMIEANVIHHAYMNGCKQLLLLGSSCIYPKMAKQPMSEEALLTGKLEATNEPYAIAKIAGIKLCESYNRQYNMDYRSAMPTNLYGPGDNFHQDNSHVIPALLRRFHDAKTANAEKVIVWGTGKARREFLHVDDMASASIHMMMLDKSNYKNHTEAMTSHINIGTGIDIEITELVTTIAKVVGYTGSIVWDSSKPDGAPRKLLNINKLNQLGWKAAIKLEDGLSETYEWFVKNQLNARV